MRDFTTEKYKQLLSTLRIAGYRFSTLEEFANGETAGKVCILRHDVDARPEAATIIAELEQSMGIRASYYFRAVLPSNRPDCIQRVVKAGHELGYHYEDLALAKGDCEEAWEHFQQKLVYFRQFYPVKTICAHGSPRSAYDNRDLWDYFDYKSLGVICEPYLDVDFRETLYLTDTGRRWDGYKFAIRDKIPYSQESWKERGLVFHTTNDIIQAAQSGRLPEHILLSTHPQRWSNTYSRWFWEYCSQEVKNQMKRAMIGVRGG